MNNLQLRREIIRISRQFDSSGLSLGTSGNLSARTRKGFLVTPSGVEYDALTPEDIIELDRDGKVLVGRLIPSSEWQVHRDIYRDKPEINAIVHVHSTWATAVSCLHRDIPAIHYHIALAGGNSIPCADYATFGTAELSCNAVRALNNRYACLLANHGQIALGDSLARAMKMAREVEQLARLFCIASQVGSPVVLDDGEIAINVEKFKSYGHQHQ